MHVPHLRELHLEPFGLSVRALADSFSVAAGRDSGGRTMLTLRCPDGLPLSSSLRRVRPARAQDFGGALDASVLDLAAPDTRKHGERQ